MARLLTFSQYLGGADNVIVLEAFPRSRKKYTYSFQEDISAFVFSGDYQSILIDNVTYDRSTGEPNFTESLVLGTFDNYTSIPSANFDTSQPENCTFVIPQDRYSGNIFPDARTSVVATVVAFEWQRSSASDAQTETHRYVILERWEPGVPIGDPTQSSSPTYSALIT
jgi:hypothetical protein